MSTTLDEEKYIQRRQKVLEKAKRYRDKKKMEGKWRYSISFKEKVHSQVGRTKLYHWFISQTQIKGSAIQRKISRTPFFNQSYEIVISPITKMPVIHIRNFDKPIYSYECMMVHQEIKNLFEDWLKEDQEFYQQITSDESFTSQFKISQRAIKKETQQESEQ